MLLYHGTSNISAHNIVTHGIDFGLCDEFTDNGRGFYLSQRREFAERRAEVMTPQSETPVVITMEFDEGNAAGKLNILRFGQASDDWQFFVVFNRIGKEYYKVLNELFPGKAHNLYAAYDVVIDVPADARISSKTRAIEKLVKEFVVVQDRIVYRERILKEIASVAIGNERAQAKQVSFHTDRSLKYLKVSE